MNKSLIALLILGLLVATTACSTKSNVKTIAEVKDDANIGKNFTVHGTVVSSVKIGSISGYRLNDSTDNIPISSQSLPKIGDEVTVTGVLQKSGYFGLYIVAEE